MVHLMVLAQHSAATPYIPLPSSVVGREAIVFNTSTSVGAIPLNCRPKILVHRLQMVCLDMIISRVVSIVGD